MINALCRFSAFTVRCRSAITNYWSWRARTASTLNESLRLFSTFLASPFVIPPLGIPMQVALRPQKCGSHQDSHTVVAYVEPRGHPGSVLRPCTCGGRRASIRGRREDSRRFLVEYTVFCTGCTDHRCAPTLLLCASTERPWSKNPFGEGTFMQLQYVQTVHLNFATLTLPHVSVTTLVRSSVLG